MISPTVGRIVWYHPGSMDAADVLQHSPSSDSPARGQPLAAIVAYVWSDRLVNLSVIDHGGKTHPRASIVLQQGDESDAKLNAGAPWCEWMPYQLGQAAKTEEALGAKVKPADGKING